MSDSPEYTAFDLARHILPCEEYATYVQKHEENDHTVARVIAMNTSIGYGGHYYEPIEQDEEVLTALATHLAPLYSMSVHRAEQLLEHVRMEWAHRLIEANDVTLEGWRQQGWYTEVGAQDLDHCASCGREIKDQDEIGCEDAVGQRWCVVHALEAVAALRGRLT